MDERVDATKGEILALAHMLKRARKENLEVEVVWSLVRNVRDGEKDILQAACAALYDWDI